nr:acid-sensing ion channel 2 [Ciona intestinalis]|eukprot:XP_009860713.1 acid-sensing ion channel 2 [Ciona intestinalis]
MIKVQIADRCNAYFAYKTSVQIKDVFVNEIPLPAITVCNFNRYFGIDNPIEQLAMDQLSTVLDNRYNIESVLYHRHNESVNYFNWTKPGFSLRNYMMDKGWNFVNGYNQGIYFPTVFYCTLGKTVACSHANFTAVLTNHLGVCYTLNVNTSQTIAGKMHGFTVVLDTYQNQYTENIIHGNWEGGILFQVHSPYEPPEVDRFGYSVGTGTWCSAAIQKLKFTNMPTPWGVCNPANEVLKYHDTYTLSACMKECVEKRIIDICGCRGPSIINPEDIPECSPVQALNCFAKELAKAEAVVTPQNCNCAYPCKDIKYQTTLSYSTFPHVNGARQAEALFNFSKGHYHTNVVGLSVYYESLTITKIEESQSITGSALLSDIGGQLGLWIGISVVTLFEFFQFIVRFVHNEIISLRKPKVTKTQVLDIQLHG